MTIPEIKAAQEKALSDFAYYTGLLSACSGSTYEEPRVEFPDNSDFARLGGMYWDRVADGYADRDKVSETV